MRRPLLLILLLLLCLAPLATVYGQSCTTPAPTATPVPSYSSVVLGIAPSNLVAYWQLNETSGSTAADSSGNGHDGTYSGVTLNATTFVDGSPAGTWDGVNDEVNAFSAGLASDWNSNELTILAWFQVAASADWTDGTQRFAASFRGSSALVQMSKSTTSNQFAFSYPTGSNTTASLSSTGWVSIAVTRTVTGNVQKAFVNGTSVGSASATSSAVTLTSARFGRRGDAGVGYWNGSLRHVAVWDVALSDGDVSTLATVPSAPSSTPTPTVAATCPPTATPGYYLEMETPGGAPARVERTVTIGGFVQILLIAAILFSIWLMFFSDVLKGDKEESGDIHSRRTRGDVGPDAGH